MILHSFETYNLEEKKRKKEEKKFHKNIIIFNVPNMTQFLCENWDFKNPFCKKASPQIKKLIKFFRY
jgi:hypothetical protein